MARNKRIDEGRFFRFWDKDGHGISLRVPGYDDAVNVGSLWVVENDECTLAVMVMGRQDQTTSWGVMFTEADGHVKSKTGLTDAGYHYPESEINAAIAELIKLKPKSPS